MHQSVAQVLRTLWSQHQPQDLAAANQIVDNALATVVFSTRCSVSRALNMSPGALVFHRDMFLDLPVLANLASIQQHRQGLIDENLRRQNAKR